MKPTPIPNARERGYYNPPLLDRAQSLTYSAKGAKRLVCGATDVKLMGNQT